jgi:predicted secreted protein
MAVHSQGTVLKLGANSIAELNSIGGLSLSADSVDVTTLTSTDGFREFIAGYKDAGEVSLSGNFKPNDTNGQAALLTNFIDGSTDEYTIVFPEDLGYEWSFDAFVTGYSTAASLDGQVTFEATLKVTGKPTLTVSA